MDAILSAKLINVTAAALAGGALFLEAGTGTAHAANGKVVATVSLSTQTHGSARSTAARPSSGRSPPARKGYVTPTGSFKPTRMHEMWYSRKYDNAPMPHSVFFHGGYAVHATDAVKRLGRPASHGCVRLHPDDAADFYALVEGLRRRPTPSIVIVK